MAITAGNTGVQLNGSGVTSFTYSIDVGSGTDRLLFVQLWFQNARTISAITYNSVAMTNIATLSLAFNERHAAYYLVNPASGSNTLSVTFSGSTQYVCTFHSLFGVDQSSPLGANRTETGNETGLTIAEALTTTTDDSWIMWATREYGGRTITAGADTTLLQRENTVYGAILARSTAGAPAGVRTLNLTANLSANWFTDIIAEFKPAAGGGAAPRNPLFFGGGL
jgi:hypothetical protein